MNIELTVIVPVYNVEKYIEKCIQSLKAQNCSNIEFLIIDDGSKDDSILKCEKLINGDERFWIIHKKNGGLMSAWKAGVSVAHGEYIGFVDSDDWVDSDMFSTLLSKIKSTGADIVSSGFIAESDGKSTVVGRDEEYIFQNEQIKEEFVREYCCSYFRKTCHPTICRWDKIYRKNILINNMSFFNEKVSLGEDFNANIAMILDAKKIVLMKNYTPYHYRYNPTSIVNSLNPRAFENIIELSKACKKICDIKNVDSLYIDSFIGNIIFEEINKKCRMNDFTNETKRYLKNNIQKSNAMFYLKKYVMVRGKIRLKLYYWVLKNNMFDVIRVMNRAYVNKG